MSMSPTDKGAGQQQGGSWGGPSQFDTQAIMDAMGGGGGQTTLSGATDQPTTGQLDTGQSGQTATTGLQPSDLASPSALNPSGNEALGMANWGGMMTPEARASYSPTLATGGTGGPTGGSALPTGGTTK